MIQGRRFMLALFYVNNTNHLTIINHLPSTIYHQPSIINHQPSTVNHQPSIINHQPFLQPKIVEIKPLFWIFANNHFQNIYVFLHRRGCSHLTVRLLCGSLSLTTDESVFFA